MIAYRLGVVCLTVTSLVLAASPGRAETVTYTLDDLFLVDGEQITGSFDWTYTVGDFAGGTGEFTALDIPYTIYSLADGNLITTIQADSIEISGDGNYHDVGLDIRIFLAQPLAPTSLAPIDLALSFFECCGNGFKDQPFQSGSVSPVVAMGDGNGDGWVDGLDYLVWAGAFGTHPGPDGDPSDGDYNDDGWVDGLDYLLWAENFGTHVVTSVPEPVSGCLLVGGLALATCVRRPRHGDAK